MRGVKRVESSAINPEESLETKESIFPNLSNENKRLILYVTRPEEAHNCHFWVGLYRHGPLRAPRLLEFHSIDEIYDQAALEGLNDISPIFLADTSHLPAKGYYLLPVSQDKLKDQHEQMIQAIQVTLEAMRPNRVGFYFSPDLVKKEGAQELLRLTLKSMSHAHTKEYYLYAGAHGVNTILNTALEVKKMLADQFEVIVFH